MKFLECERSRAVDKQLRGLAVMPLLHRKVVALEVLVGVTFGHLDLYELAHLKTKGGPDHKLSLPQTPAKPLQSHR